MATDHQKKRNIKYLNKDFNSLKSDFIEHLRTYFSDTIEDYSESSVGIMLTELAAFVGDNYSFYLDKKFNESFLDTAKEKKNIFKHGKQLGFKAFGKAAATGYVDAYLEVPAVITNEKVIPDIRYAGIIKKGAKLKNKDGKTYETLLDIDFSTVDINDPNYAQVSSRDSTTNVPLTFALKVSSNLVKAGETKTATFSIGSYEAFKKITLADEDVLEVIKVVDTQGNDWYETDFLAQDTIFYGVKNNASDYSTVPYVLKLKSVPYRFITEYDIENNKTTLIFGTGDADSFDGELIPDLGDLSLPLYGKDTFGEFDLDPQNFLKTRTLGLCPVNTTLTVDYRVGGGKDTNAGVGEIDTVASSVFDVSDSSLPSSTVRDVGNTFSVSNSVPIVGGKDEYSIDELKQLIAANFSAQNRMVTAEDFIVRAMSMPSRFGSVFRANARVNPLNNNAVELVVLSRDTSGYVTTCSSTLKNNLRKYLEKYRLLTDAIEILDGEIVNVGIKFSIMASPDFSSNIDVLTNCIAALKDYFDIQKWQIGQPINESEIKKVLMDVDGVMCVFELSVINKTGTFDGRTYSNIFYNIDANSENGLVYCDSNRIFEVKFPNKDIIGTVK